MRGGIELRLTMRADDAGTDDYRCYGPGHCSAYRGKKPPIEIGLLVV